eukprot:GHVS01016639.1.p2 GENE.GHVS01016639.1~~GHVS01016639.1.p2  ORF type:complete len:105 (-),score=10.59 GHVS01016639.1:260-574(-)
MMLCPSSFVTSSHVSFPSRALISYSMAVFHCSALLSSRASLYVCGSFCSQTETFPMNRLGGFRCLVDLLTSGVSGVEFSSSVAGISTYTDLVCFCLPYVWSLFF